MKQKNNIFVPVYNKFLNRKKVIDPKTSQIIENKQTLTPDELYIYFILHLRRNYDTGTHITNVDLLSQQVKYHSKQDRNKPKIKKLLQSLKNKGVINFENEIKSYSTLLDISFNSIEGGYEQIQKDIFEKTDDPEEFFVMCLIKSLKRPQISYQEFADRIGCSYNHAVKIIQNMGNDYYKNRILNIYRGQYYQDENGKLKQETNQYEIRKNKHSKFEDRKHNWYDKDKRITVDDFRIYLTTKDERLKKHAEGRIKAIETKYPNFSEEMKYKIEKENNYKKRQQEMIDNATPNPQIDGYFDDIEWFSEEELLTDKKYEKMNAKYEENKKNKHINENDISDLLI